MSFSTGLHNCLYLDGIIYWSGACLEYKCGLEILLKDVSNLNVLNRRCFYFAEKSKMKNVGHINEAF